MQSISCNWLSAVLKVKQMAFGFRMVVFWSLTLVITWLTGACLAATAQPHKGGLNCLSPAWEAWFLLSALCFCTVVKLKNPKSNHHKSGTVCTLKGKTKAFFKNLLQIRFDSISLLALILISPREKDTHTIFWGTAFIKRLSCDVLSEHALSKGQLGFLYRLFIQ